MQQSSKDDPIVLDLESPKLNKLYFVCTINSREVFTDPNYLQIDLTTHKSDIILALKIPQTVAIISLQGLKAQNKGQYYENSQNPLCAFRLIDYNTLLCGYPDGKILKKTLNPQEDKKEYNRINNQPYIKKKVIKLHYFQNLFVTLFSDGIFALFDEKYNTRNIVESEKLFSLSFNNHKKVVQTKVLKEMKDNGLCYKFQHYSEFTNFQFQQKDANPLQLYRFESTSLNDVEILPYSPLEHMKIKMDSGLCLAICGLDGYFRLFECYNNLPLFSFKIESGGICSFAFNPNYTLVCLGGQDDSAYIISFNKELSWIRLVGHNSFICRGVFNSISATEFRVICGCYDGTFSITDMKIEQFRKEEKLYIEIQNSEENSIKVKNVNMMCQDGIGYITEYQNYLISLNFDGSIRIYLLQ